MEPFDLQKQPRRKENFSADEEGCKCNFGTVLSRFGFQYEAWPVSNIKPNRACLGQLRSSRLIQVWV